MLGWAAFAFLAAAVAALVLFGAQTARLSAYTAGGVILCIFVCAWTYHRTRDIFHPLTFFTIAYMLFALGLQLYAPIFGVPAGFETELASRSGKYPELVAMLPLGVLGLWLGVKVADKLTATQSFSRFDPFALRLTRVPIHLRSLALMGMAVATSILWYQLFERGGISSLLAQYGQNQYTYDSSYYLSLLSQFLWIPSFLLFAAESFHTSRGMARIILSAVPFLAPLTIYGNRFLLLIVVLGVVITWHVRRSPMTLTRLLMVVVPVVASITVLGQFRGERSADALELSLRSLLQEVLAPGAGAGAVTMAVTNLVPLVLPFQYGSTFVASILNLVPGFVFGPAGRSFFNPSLVFHDIYSPGLTDHGFGFSMTAEAYMNWGVWGALPVLLLVGLILGLSYNYLRVRRDSYSIALYTIVVFESLWFLRADSTVYIKAILFPILVMKFISLFADRKDAFSIQRELLQTQSAQQLNRDGDVA